MDAAQKFLRHLALFRSISEQDLYNPLLQHGVIHAFQEQFDLGIEMLQAFLKKDGKGMAAMGSEKEIIAAAYEEYLFVDETIWIRMWRDRHVRVGQYDRQTVVFRILREYAPAWQQFCAGAGIS